MRLYAANITLDFNETWTRATQLKRRSNGVMKRRVAPHNAIQGWLRTYVKHVCISVDLEKREAVNCSAI